MASLVPESVVTKQHPSSSALNHRTNHKSIKLSAVLSLTVSGTDRTTFFQISYNLQVLFTEDMQPILNMVQHSLHFVFQEKAPHMEMGG